ncbi:hypothetical protein H4Q26_017462 [Puccinia striiformis f. sp. tritici PST-130]|nr:hypothetical protein H4Q26_017462 [Puccinia striiformis f. sp. tritici PST-130]
MESSPITNDNTDRISDPPTIPDQQVSSPTIDADRASPALKPSGTNPPVKRGIAAAIAAFEKGAGDKPTSPRASPAVPLQPTNIDNIANQPTDETPVKPTDETSVKPADEAPIKSADEAPVKPASASKPLSASKSASPVKPGSPVKKEPTAAGKKSEPATAKAHTRPSGATATTKAPVRPSTATRPPPGRTATKPSAPPALGASRRTSIISTATRVPPKTTTTSAVAATGHSCTRKKLSTAPSATIAKTATTKPAAHASSQATAELESKLSQTESQLAAKSEELANLEGRLEEATKSAAAEREKLSAEIESLNAKLEEIANAPQPEASQPEPAISTAEHDAMKADLEAAKVRITELEGLIDSHQKEQVELQNRHSESSSEVAQLEESVKELKQQLEEAIVSKEASIAEAASQHAKELDAKLDEARTEFEAQKSALESQLGELERQTKEVQSEAATQLETTLATELTKKTEEISQKHSEELEELKAQHASQVETLTSEHESALQAYAFAESQDATASSDAARKEEHALELATAIEEAKSIAKEELESSIAALKEEHAAALAKLESELLEAQEAKSAVNNELDELKAQNQAFNAEKQVLEERLSADIEALKTEHALQLEQEYHRAKDELNEAHIDQLKSFRQTSQESTEQLLQSHKAELEAIRSALLSDFASEKATIEAEFEQAKLELSALHSDLLSTQKSKQDHSEKIDRLTGELETARVALAELEAKANEPVKSDELEELQRVLEKTQSDAEDQKLALEKEQAELVANFEHARELHSQETTQHIEEKTLLQKELATFRDRVESADERIKMSQALVDELSQTIEQEMSNGHTNTNLIELHEAHNLKILELTNEVEKWKDIAAKKEDEAEEKQFRIKLLEEMIEKDDDDVDENDNDNDDNEHHKEEISNPNTAFANKHVLGDDDDDDDRHHHQEDLETHHSKIQAEGSPANNYGQDLSIKFKRTNQCTVVLLRSASIFLGDEMDHKGATPTVIVSVSFFQNPTDLQAVGEILGALLILWFSRFTESTHPVLIKRVSDPSAIPPPPPAPVVKTNIHCGDEFASYKPNDPLLRSCTDYGLVKYSCDTSQCHAGEQGDDAHSGSIDQQLYFKGCHKLGDRGKMTYLVYAISYLARNKKGYLIAIGFAVGDPLEMVYNFKCPWNGNGDRNNRRVWCDKCYPVT